METAMVKESHERYRVPVVRVPAVAANNVKFGEGMVLQREAPAAPLLQAYFRPLLGVPLVVVFHGAVRLDKDTYPRFDRVSTLSKQNVSFLSFADPTLTIASDLALGWYLGNEEWDPLESILATIREAADTTQASEILLVGGSGGGYAALRAAARLPRSSVFVFSPQTVLANYNRRIVAHYFASAFPSHTQEMALASDPSRFSVVDLYERSRPPCALYFLQNLNDGTHVAGHYAPMKRALSVAGVQGCDVSGKYRFVLFDSKRMGHGAPFPDEFEWHFGAARAHFAEVRERWSSGD